MSEIFKRPLLLAYNKCAVIVRKSFVSSDQVNKTVIRQKRKDFSNVTFSHN